MKRIFLLPILLVLVGCGTYTTVTAKPWFYVRSTEQGYCVSVASKPTEYRIDFKCSLGADEALKLANDLNHHVVQSGLWK